MHKSVELAERNAEERVSIKHVDAAEEKIEKDRILEAISIHPKQFQLVLYSIISISTHTRERIFTGEIYELYKKICSQTGLRPLTQRRISDVIAEFDMLGIINASIISKGRYGRTREISLSISSSIEQKIKDVLAEGLVLS